MQSSRSIVAMLTLVICVACGYAWAQDAADPSPRFQGPGRAKGLDLSGVWVGTYASNKVSETDVTLIFQQSGSTVTGTYLTGNGAQGTMTGVVNQSGRIDLRADQFTPTCLGEYAMTRVKVTKRTLTWRFVGWDCLGFQDGAGEGGKAIRVQG